MCEINWAEWISATGTWVTGLAVVHITYTLSKQNNELQKAIVEIEKGRDEREEDRELSEFFTNKLVPEWENFANLLKVAEALRVEHPTKAHLIVGTYRRAFRLRGGSARAALEPKKFFDHLLLLDAAKWKAAIDSLS